jgi:hypothetical protein
MDETGNHDVKWSKTASEGQRSHVLPRMKNLDLNVCIIYIYIYTHIHTYLYIYTYKNLSVIEGLSGGGISLQGRWGDRKRMLIHIVSVYEGGTKKLTESYWKIGAGRKGEERAIKRVNLINV